MSQKLDAIELGRALIRCESVTPEDGGALDVLKGALQDIGFSCELLSFSEDGTPDISNLYARIGEGAPHFCFAGHTDTVPVGDPENWSADPFGAEIRNGMLYGRGAADMKTALACFAAAAERFLAGRGDFSGSISLLITGDEEGPAINGTKKLLEWAAARGEKFDACLVGEPTNPDALGEMIKIGRRGSLNCSLTVPGTSGHTAYPHLADNPVHRLIDMLAALTAEALDRGSDHFQPSSLQISTIDVGNPATNVIPAKAEAGFNVRFNDLYDVAGIETWIAERLDRVGGEYDLGIYVSGEAFLTPPGRFSEIIAGAVRRITGRTPELSTSGGTSDARFIKDYCAVAEFGLVGRTMHKADECAALSDLEALTDIYTAILEDYFAPDG
ncbi:MAG: succinyl-diaminopimelate desuccinylase [Rhodospirillales bacterium]|jgi:succinyl-diaminopimelate desuccinylase|nr:succinyl-diaminopimelate desuccinylase [Rhodospirillales bacterium]MDP6642495.1 succinyl-diaminopimelate desuccinylase [Rhodospirillales bacterium]MDP6841437.1 succinyl-diaminopimelate desuccinylase [Rhodospirillales bacterium]